jgi:hypothetical protein
MDLSAGVGATIWYTSPQEYQMLNPRIVAEAANRLKNRAHRTAAVDRIVVARIVAGSHRLEGINTSPEAVLAAAEATSARRTVAAS